MTKAKTAPAAAKWELRLYVAGQTGKSLQAFVNLKRICEDHLAGEYRIEVIDLMKNPQLAQGDQILALPTLVRKLPEPVRKIIGDLSNTESAGWFGPSPQDEQSILMRRIPKKQPARANPDTAAFEEALAAQRGAEHYVLRLYISGSAPRSARAIENIRALCEERLRGRYGLEVIDIYQHPEDVRPEQIVVTPTLLKKLPLPLRKIIGDLSDTERVLAGLDLMAVKPPEKFSEKANES